MKSTWQTSLFAILIISNAYLIYQHFRSNEHLVYVDSARLINGYKGMVSAKSAYQQAQLADYQKAINEKAAQEDGQMTKKVIDEINQYIKDYGKNNNLRIILGATDYGNVAYAQDAMDSTDEIL